MSTISRKRRGPRLDERLTPCEVCAHPISQRHHLLPVARYGEDGATVHICANCHEIYHIIEQGLLDLAGGRSRSRSRRCMIAILRAPGWDGGNDPRIKYMYALINWSHARQAEYLNTPSPVDSFDAFLVFFGSEPPKEVVIRRGDMVRLTNGRIVQVVGVAGGCVHTTEGPYESWQVERVAKA